jgi:hypothetical protein
MVSAAFKNICQRAMSTIALSKGGPKDALRLAWAHLLLVPRSTIPDEPLGEELLALRSTVAPSRESDFVEVINSLTEEEAQARLHQLNNFLVKVCPPE